MAGLDGDIYKIDNPCISARIVTFNEGYTNRYLDACKSENGLSLYYRTFGTHTEQISSQNTRKYIPLSVGSAIATLHCMVLDSNNVRGNWTLGNFSLNNFSTFQLRYGSNLYPSDLPISSVSQAYSELRKSLGIYNSTMNTGLLTKDNYAGQAARALAAANVGQAQPLVNNSNVPCSFIWGIELEKENYGHLNGLNLNNVQLQMDLTLSAYAGANSAVLYSFVLHERELRISDNFTLTVNM